MISSLFPNCAYPMQSSTHPVPTLCPTLCPPMFSIYRRPCQVLSIYQRSENSSMTLSEYNLIHVVHETIKLLKYLRKKNCACIIMSLTKAKYVVCTLLQHYFPINHTKCNIHFLFMKTLENVPKELIN